MADDDSTDRGKLDRWWMWFFAALFLAVGLARAFSALTENVNWDEFALLQRAETLARTGVLVGGGRPGLATMVLEPFADGCRNAVDALVGARHLWTFFVLASALGFWLLLRRVLPDTPTRALAVATGVGLWVLAPSFLRYSVQVRTDQLAVLGGIWGGVLLLAALERRWLAPLAGAAMAIGFLASQKLVYVAGPVLILVGAWHLIERDFSWRREAWRAGLFVAGGVATVVVFDLVSGGSARLAPDMGDQLSTFAFYRERSGFYYYLFMLPGLVAQFVALVHILIASLAWVRMPERREGALLLAAWLVVAAGVVVIGFHAGRFPYFYIVLGLFPAAAGALVVAWLLNGFQTDRARAGLLAFIWVPLAGTALIESRAMVGDDLSHQRASLAFVHEALTPEARGFSDYGVFPCRHDPDPFPTRFGLHVINEFGGEDRDARAEDLVSEFRDRPVTFMIESTQEYPEQVLHFWDTHYVHYYGHISVVGRRIEEGDMVQDFEPLVSGTYRWWPDAEDDPLLVDGRPLPAGEAITLDVPGTVTLAHTGTTGGIFALDVGRPPQPDDSGFFTAFLRRRQVAPSSDPQ